MPHLTSLRFLGGGARKASITTLMGGNGIPSKIGVDTSWIRKGRSEFGCCSQDAFKKATNPERADLFWGGADY